MLLPSICPVLLMPNRNGIHDPMDQVRVSPAHYRKTQIGLPHRSVQCSTERSVQHRVAHKLHITMGSSELNSMQRSIESRYTLLYAMNALGFDMRMQTVWEEPGLAVTTVYYGGGREETRKWIETHELLIFWQTYFLPANFMVCLYIHDIHTYVYI